MGLNISTFNRYEKIADYDRLGSYSTLHVLRNWIFEELLGKEVAGSVEDREAAYDGNYGDFEAILNHSDAEGYYISFSEFKIKEVEDPSWTGDLDKLRQELVRLRELRDQMPEDVLAVYNRLDDIVNREKEDSGRANVVIFL